jgi:hypothetical protein
LIRFEFTEEKSCWFNQRIETARERFEFHRYVKRRISKQRVECFTFTLQEEEDAITGIHNNILKKKDLIRDERRKER